MEIKQTSEIVTINRDEIKSEIKAVFGEVLTDSLQNIGVRLTSVLFGDSESASNPQPTVDTAPPADAFPCDNKVENCPEDFHVVISGYLYMCFKELGYTPADLRRVMQKLEVQIGNHGFNEARAAYKRAELELIPLIIEGITVPAEFNSLRIMELKYSNSSVADNKMALRVMNSLSKAGVTYLSDLRDKDLNDIKYFGVNARNELKIALSRTIGVSAAGNSQLTETAENEKKPQIEQPPIRIKGITVPCSCFDFKIADLGYDNAKLATRITKALNNQGITYIRDFQDNPDKAKYIHKVRNLGKGSVNEFLAALKRVVDSTAADETAPVASAATPTVGIISDTIAGIKIPPEYHNYEIGQLNYASNISKAKTAASLRNKGITHISDFFKPENSNVKSILSAKGYKSFIESLERTIGG